MSDHWVDWFLDNWLFLIFNPITAAILIGMFGYYFFKWLKEGANQYAQDMAETLDPSTNYRYTSGEVVEKKDTEAEEEEFIN